MFELTVGVRVPFYHEADLHLDAAGGFVLSYILLPEPRLHLGLGANIVALTGIRLIESRKVSWDLGLRLEQAFVATAANHCMRFGTLGGGCEQPAPEYPFRVGLTTQVMF